MFCDVETKIKIANQFNKYFTSNDIVNSAKSKKACGCDNIDPYAVQQVIPHIATQHALWL